MCCNLMHMCLLILSLSVIKDDTDYCIFSLFSKYPVSRGVACGAASAAGSSSSENDINPYEVMC